MKKCVCSCIMYTFYLFPCFSSILLARFGGCSSDRTKNYSLGYCDSYRLKR